MKPSPKIKGRKPKPDFWNKSDSAKSRSMDNEKRIAREVGFSTTPGSGNQPWASKKGDGVHPLFLFELKETQKTSISVNKSVVSKINREAGVQGKDPIIILSAYGLPEPIPKEWAVVPLPVFEQMLRAYEKEQSDE